ncbi:hypothetical protein NPIL_41821 [Nephila pilipes]|uniref:Uncharacterized protein n=1 Tax=Nephila pilipes TaxID=299642 RepID=A0A8X6NJ81_NEPPI|nr:hypothetical protein NPIL_41821 [Nephila pilipes]
MVQLLVLARSRFDFIERSLDSNLAEVKIGRYKSSDVLFHSPSNVVSRIRPFSQVVTAELKATTYAWDLIIGGFWNMGSVLIARWFSTQALVPPEGDK